ncbi:MAG TPA: NfeD family protein [Kiritimatiellia bacterium]|nr:NfeD family protein [Kiritimatiellia bacterium]
MSGELFNLYWILIAAGFVLIAAEVFIPGGILGVIGVFALIGAGLLGFSVFGVKGGFFSALGLLIGGAVFISIWVKYLPRSGFGKWFTLETDGKEFKSFDDSKHQLIGHSGTAHTDLRPAGIALIDGKKVDVVSEAGFIPHGAEIKVIEAVGNRVVVRQVDAS